MQLNDNVLSNLLESVQYKSWRKKWDDLTAFALPKALTSDCGRFAKQFLSCTSFTSACAGAMIEMALFKSLYYFVDVVEDHAFSARRLSRGVNPKGIDPGRGNISSADARRENFDACY